MVMLKKAILAVSIALTAFTGCATTGTVRSSLDEGGGAQKMYEGKSYDQVYSAALRVMSNKFTITKESKATGAIDAENSVSVMSWGELIGIQVTKVKESVVKVQVVSQKKSRGQFTGQDWEQTVLAAITSELDA